MILSKSEKQMILSLLQDTRWRVIQQLADEMRKVVRENVQLGNEWELVKSTLLAEGEARGIKRFIDYLYEQAQSLNETQ